MSEFARIALPDGLGEVQLEDLGEHHMASNSIIIHVPFPIDGFTRFETTNGDAFYSERTGHLVIRDACVMMRYHLKTKTVDSVSRPNGWYMSTIEEAEGGYEIAVYDGNRRETLRVVHDDFQPGAIWVENGRFPSAYP